MHLNSKLNSITKHIPALNHKKLLSSLSDRVHKSVHEPIHKHMSEEQLDVSERRGNWKVGTEPPRAQFDFSGSSQVHVINIQHNYRRSNPPGGHVTWTANNHCASVVKLWKPRAWPWQTSGKELFLISQAKDDNDMYIQSQCRSI